MDIHQMQVRYVPAEDRLLWQLRTFGNELFQVWLTRRMFKLMAGPLQLMVEQSAVRQRVPDATPVPEARQMLADQAREQPLPGADFATPFQAAGNTTPLGQQPLLAQHCDIGPGPDGAGLHLRVSEPEGRSLSIRLSDPLASALQRLIEQALPAADWDLAVRRQPAPQATPPRSAMN